MVAIGLSVVAAHLSETAFAPRPNASEGFDWNRLIAFPP
jgi:hypothetical protein